MAWIGTDDPQRIDAATVAIDGSTLRATGTQRTTEWALAWALTCDKRWITRRMRVHALGPSWSRTLDLTHDGVGSWTSVTATDGDAGPDRPGVTDPHALRAALDCDLGLCPLTNVMPIRRLGLGARPGDEHVLTMAWIDVPSLAVIQSIQRYRSIGEGIVRYESEQRDFTADLTVDADGLVVDYPQLAQRWPAP